MPVSGVKKRPSYIDHAPTQPASLDFFFRKSCVAAQNIVQSLWSHFRMRLPSAEGYPSANLFQGLNCANYRFLWTSPELRVKVPNAIYLHCRSDPHEFVGLALLQVGKQIDLPCLGDHCRVDVGHGWPLFRGRVGGACERCFARASELSAAL